MGWNLPNNEKHAHKFPVPNTANDIRHILHSLHLKISLINFVEKSKLCLHVYLSVEVERPRAKMLNMHWRRPSRWEARLQGVLQHKKILKGWIKHQRKRGSWTSRQSFYTCCYDLAYVQQITSDHLPWDSSVLLPTAGHAKDFILFVYLVVDGGHRVDRVAGDRFLFWIMEKHIDIT